jgi:hypothetical protein
VLPEKIREIIQMFRENGFKIRFMASCPITPEPAILTVLRKKIGTNWFRLHNASYEQLEEKCKQRGTLHIVFSKE